MRAAAVVALALLLTGCVADGQIPRITSLARDENVLRGHMWTLKGSEPQEAILVQGLRQGEIYHTDLQFLDEQLKTRQAHIVARGPVNGGDFAIPLVGIDMLSGQFAIGFVYDNSTVTFALQFDGTTAIVEGTKTYYAWQDEWPGLLLLAVTVVVISVLAVWVIRKAKLNAT
jgi:hypothetical protein